MNIGRFIDLNAEEAERSVEKYFTAINKAAKFFNKLELKEQAETANLIKSQINRFRPEMPLLVTLRNPGMRDRHWEKVSYCFFCLHFEFIISYRYFPVYCRCYSECQPIHMYSNLSAALKKNQFEN